jgi:DNA-binding MarR family transcriptional regulator
MNSSYPKEIIIMKWDRENLPDCIVFFLAKAYQKAHGRFKEALKPYGLTNMQHLVLEALWYQEGFTAAELGKHLVLDKATMSGVIERLAEGGWLERRPDPRDGRVQRLYTSAKANGMKDALVGLRQATNNELLSGFTPEERMLFKRFLMDFS